VNPVALHRAGRVTVGKGVGSEGLVQDRLLILNIPHIGDGRRIDEDHALVLGLDVDPAGRERLTRGESDLFMSGTAQRQSERWAVRPHDSNPMSVAENHLSRHASRVANRPPPYPHLGRGKLWNPVGVAGHGQTTQLTTA
jgi:hypothetical protein